MKTVDIYNRGEYSELIVSSAEFSISDVAAVVGLSAHNGSIIFPTQRTEALISRLLVKGYSLYFAPQTAVYLKLLRRLQASPKYRFLSTGLNGSRERHIEYTGRFREIMRRKRVIS